MDHFWSAQRSPFTDFYLTNVGSPRRKDDSWAPDQGLCEYGSWRWTRWDEQWLGRQVHTVEPGTWQL